MDEWRELSRQIAYLDKLCFLFIIFLSISKNVKITTWLLQCTILQEVYVKKPNKIFAWHLSATQWQQPGESLEELLQKLRKVSKVWDLKAVTAGYREE